MCFGAKFKWVLSLSKKPERRGDGHAEAAGAVSQGGHLGRVPEGRRRRRQAVLEAVEIDREVITRPSATTKQWEKKQDWPFFVFVQLIHRLTQVDISCTTAALLFFFPLLGHYRERLQ